MKTSGFFRGEATRRSCNYWDGRASPWQVELDTCGQRPCKRCGDFGERFLPLLHLFTVLGDQLIGLGSRASQVSLECRIFLCCFPVCLLNVAGIYFEYFDRTDNQDDQAYVAQILLDQLIEQHDWVLPYLPKAAINIMGLCHFEGTRFSKGHQKKWPSSLFSFPCCWGGGYFETYPHPHRLSIVAEYGRGAPISKGRVRQATSAPRGRAHILHGGVHFFPGASETQGPTLPEAFQALACRPELLPCFLHSVQWL